MTTLQTIMMFIFWALTLVGSGFISHAIGYRKGMMAAEYTFKGIFSRLVKEGNIIIVDETPSES